MRAGSPRTRTGEADQAAQTARRSQPPADLPVELLTSFELTVNLKTLHSPGVFNAQSLASHVTAWIQ